MTSASMLTLAIQALDDPAVLPVLGDLVLETGWFDPRVMQTMWPRGKGPRGGYRTKKQRDKAKTERSAHKAGYPEFFKAMASQPTQAWARAIAAVLLFGGWRQRPKCPWPVVARCRRSTMLTYYGSATVTINGVPFDDVANMTGSSRDVRLIDRALRKAM